LRSKKFAENLALTSNVRRILSAGRRSKNKIQFRTRDGLLLLASIEIFVALVFVLVYLVWYLPMQKAIR